MRRHRCEFGGSPLERGFGALTTLGGLVAMLWAATTFTPGVRLLDDIVPIGLVAIATWYAWRNLVRPRVTITDSEITVLNGVRVYNVPIGQIAEVTATSRGIAIRTEEGDRIEPVVAGASVLSSWEGYRRQTALTEALERAAQQHGDDDGTRTSSRVRLELWPFVLAATACVLAIRL